MIEGTALVNRKTLCAQPGCGLPYGNHVLVKGRKGLAVTASSGCRCFKPPADCKRDIAEED